MVVSPSEVLCLLKVPEGMKVLTQSQHHWTGLVVGSAAEEVQTCFTLNVVQSTSCIYNDVYA